MSHHSSLSSGEGGLPPVSIDLQQLPPGQLGPPLVRNNLILPLIGSVVLVKLSYKETFKLTDLHHNIPLHCTTALHCTVPDDDHRQQSGLWCERVVVVLDPVVRQLEGGGSSCFSSNLTRCQTGGLVALLSSQGFPLRHLRLSSSVQAQLGIFGKSRLLFSYYKRHRYCPGFLKKLLFLYSRRLSEGRNERTVKRIL